MSRPGHAVVRLAAVCGLVLTAWPAGAQPPTAGIVKHLTGAAVVVHAGQEIPARLGQPVTEGDTIRTAADGRIGITLKDGTRLSLGGSTELRLDTFAYAPAQGHLGIAMKLLRGAAEYISGRIAQLAPGSVKVETPTTVIGIRGTHLLIGVDQP